MATSPRRRLLIASASIAVLGLCALAPGGTSAATRNRGAATIPSGTVINFGDQQQSYETLFQSSGVLSGAPYKVNFVEFASGPLVDAGFAANQLDIGEMGDTPAAESQQSGLRLTAIAVSLPTRASEFLVAEPGITTIKQLRGKAVAFTTGTAQQALALRALASAGLKQSDVQQVNVSLEQLGTAIESGAAVASVLSVEQLDDYRLSHPGAVILATNKSAKPPSYSYILATRSALANPGKHAAIEDLIRRLLKANDWRNAHQSEWVQDYYTDVEHQTIAQAEQIVRNGGISLYQPIVPSVNAALQQVVKLLYSAGAISKIFPTANLFDSSVTQSYDATLAKVPQYAS